MPSIHGKKWNASLASFLFRLTWRKLPYLTLPYLTLPPSSVPRISVIIPCYNAGTGIEITLNHLIEQTLFPDCEIICVDDCSTDSTVERIAGYVARFPAKIRLIRNVQNLGSGITQNVGIDAAKGDYLYFVAPNDYPPRRDTLEFFYRKALCCAPDDLIQGEFIHGIGDDFHIRRDHMPVKSPAETVVLPAPYYYAPSCLYNRSVIEAHHIRYGTTRRKNDTVFELQCMRHFKRLIPVHEPIYFYQKYAAGADSQLEKHKRYFLDELAAWETVLAYCAEHKMNRFFAYYLKTLFMPNPGKFCKLSALPYVPGCEVTRAAIDALLTPECLKDLESEGIPSDWTIPWEPAKEV